jgi:hypothetical protein
MWSIVLTDAAGERLEEILVEAPIEAVREQCRRLVERRPDAAQARLASPDGLLDYAYPEEAARV